MRIEPTSAQRELRARLSGSLSGGWQAIAASGVLGLTLPAEHGGAGLGLAESIIAFEELGRCLAGGPCLETVTVVELIAQGERTSPCRPLLARLMGGECTATLALGRPAHDFVRFAASADYLVIRAGDGLSLIPAGPPGVSVVRHDELSRGELCTVTLTAEPSSAALLGAASSPLFAAAMTRARTRHAAHLVGLAQGAFDLAVRYTKRRRQFGQRIATFQHLSFRMAALAARLEAARLLVQRAAWLSDCGEPAAHRSLAALAHVSDLARDVTAEAIQLHGAVGITDESDVQRYYRQAASDGLLFGTGRQLRAAALGEARGR